MTAATPPASFQTTIWSDIRRAQAGGSTALNDLLHRYRTPVVRFLRMRGFGPEDAEDVAQEVLLALTRSSVLERADASLGRFRNLILAVAKKLASRQLRTQRALKRGGGVLCASLEAMSERTGMDVSELVTARENDPEFDGAWMENLLHLSLERLRTEHPEVSRTLTLHLREGLTYEEIARRTGRSWNQVNHQIRQGRQKVVEYLRAEILQYSSTSDEFETELQHFSGLLRERMAAS